jgi:hypothetical protein
MFPPLDTAFGQPYGGRCLVLTVSPVSSRLRWATWSTRPKRCAGATRPSAPDLCETTPAKDVEQNDELFMKPRTCAGYSVGPLPSEARKDADLMHEVRSPRAVPRETHRYAHSTLRSERRYVALRWLDATGD